MKLVSAKYEKGVIHLKIEAPRDTTRADVDAVTQLFARRFVEGLKREIQKEFALPAKIPKYRERG